LSDPEGFGNTVEVSAQTALLTTLMNGEQTLTEIQREFQRCAGGRVSLVDLKALIAELDRVHLLEGPRFEDYRLACIHDYLDHPTRVAAHAGGAYAGEEDALKEQLAELFAGPTGAAAINRNTRTSGQRLCGVISPHIDLHRGGPVYTWAYQAIAEQSKADLMVIFGTSHGPMDQMFTVTRKDFETPLGVVKTDRAFIDGLADRLAADPEGQTVDLFEDELAHRLEHSIEFQTVFLQYLLGRQRPFQIVPVLVGSFYQQVETGTQPDKVPEVRAFIRAMRAAAEAYRGQICFISGADLAHIGPHFGDEELLNPERLKAQADDDHQLLAAACRGDAAAWFQRVADCGDRNRICGLSPTYTLLQVLAPSRGQLLRYDQAVEPDGSACVSFASLAFYRD
jgi:AmmeMemoRadiSam system protein B